MKHLKYIIVAVAVALFAASCSQDDYLAEDGGGTPVTGQTQAYTFTVSPDLTMEGDAKTRSEGTDAEMPTRCFMQVFDSGEPVNNDVIEGVKEDGSFIFTITLASGKSYDYCFYADNGNHDINDLRNITWQNTGKVVAYAHKWSGEPEEVMSVTLTHIVTKITLQHKGNTFTATANNGFTVTCPCVTSYNVLNPENSTTTNISFVTNFTADTQIADDQEICTYYTAVPADYAETSDITLTYRWRHLTIADVTLEQNAHVVLQGDLSPDNTKWQMSNSDVERVKYYFFDSENECKDQESSGHMNCHATREQIEDICKDITGRDFNTTVVTYRFDDYSGSVKFQKLDTYCQVELYINGVTYVFYCYYDTSYGYPSLLP